MFLPDVLDLLGKTPREFGGLHVHFESVQRVDGPLLIATLLIQSAFKPLPDGGLVIFFAGSKELARASLPSPRGADVLRVRYPLKLDADAPQVGALILAPPVNENAERVRPAWKLYDTLEIPKLSEMEPARDMSVAFDPTATAIATLLSGGLSLEFNVRNIELEAKVHATTHKARELPPHLMQTIEGVARPIGSEMTVETIWREGDPLPELKPLKRGMVAVPPPSAIKRCGACAYEGPAAELERRTTCPACDAVWG